MTPKRERVPTRRKVAYHEAGHAVLSTAINDTPHLVSIRRTGSKRGRACYQFDAPPERLIQVHLAGFAAEELLDGRPSEQLRGLELDVSIATITLPRLAGLRPIVDGCDQFLAVQEALKMGVELRNESIREKFEFFYQVAKTSLQAVWPAVGAVARALLKRSELDRTGFFKAVGKYGLDGPVSAVQEKYGLRGNA
jgi:hypothetical protein